MANIVPFSFEPEYTDAELNLKSQTKADEEIGNDWCQCARCREMPTALECVCCHSSELTVGCLKDHTCITDDRRMQTVVLNEDVLSVMYVQMLLDTGKNGRAPVALDDRYSLCCGVFLCCVNGNVKAG